jgi:hypothetical protein
MIANSVSTQQGTFVAIDVAKQVHEVLVEATNRTQAAMADQELPAGL